ncbi:uncharacterized protein LOC118458005 isoform X7 [Anopheles albimanus]|uniref:uncharacterized protein LOC118458005 isoform X7 n=1 Tax=Anopheles albimanus TaxID=7167 RepID=UPI00163F18E0|nr:uncharacterized protein LOC118458005 isoform X7 [Anopheles albimanus]
MAPGPTVSYNNYHQRPAAARGAGQCLAQSPFAEMIDENTSYYIDTSSLGTHEFDLFVNSLQATYNPTACGQGSSTDEPPMIDDGKEEEYDSVYGTLSRYAQPDFDHVSSYAGTPSSGGTSYSSGSLDSLIEPDAPHNTLTGDGNQQQHHQPAPPIAMRQSFLNIFQYFDEDVSLDLPKQESESTEDFGSSDRDSSSSRPPSSTTSCEVKRDRWEARPERKMVLRQWNTNVEHRSMTSVGKRIGKLSESLLRVFESESSSVATVSHKERHRTVRNNSTQRVNHTTPIRTDSKPLSDTMQFRRNQIREPTKVLTSETSGGMKRQNVKGGVNAIASKTAPTDVDNWMVNYVNVSNAAKIVNVAPKVTQTVPVCKQTVGKRTGNEHNLSGGGGGGSASVTERDKCHVRNINDLFLQYRSRERLQQNGVRQATGTLHDFNRHVREAIEQIEKHEEHHCRLVLGDHAFDNRTPVKAEEQPPLQHQTPMSMRQESICHLVTPPTSAPTIVTIPDVAAPNEAIVSEPVVELKPKPKQESALDMHYRLLHETYRLQMDSLIETERFVRMSEPDRIRLYQLETIFNRSHLSLIHTVLALLQENISKGDRVTLQTGATDRAANERFANVVTEGCYRIDGMKTKVLGENSVELSVIAIEEFTGRMLKLTIEFVIDVDGQPSLPAKSSGRSGSAQQFTSNADADEFYFVVPMVFEPPENELQKSHETGTNLSEHQLRVQASLQRLNIPDWYKQYSGKDGATSMANTTAPASVMGAGGTTATTTSTAGGGLLRKRNSDVGRWTGLSSKTTSLSSLGSHRSDRSPVMLSPSAHSHHGQTGFSRWSTSHLNSNQTSPSVSTRGSFTRGGLNASAMSGYSSGSNATTAGPGYGAGNTIRNSFRQPYLGWRSQEKLSQPRTPAERLASSLLQQQQQQQQHGSGKHKEQQQQQGEEQHTSNKRQHQRQPKDESVVTPEIQSSIIEVTSAIVHYVNDQTNRHSRSRSTSPSQRCWLESSFVGTRPLDSPQTPMIENSSVLGSSHHSQHQQQQHQHHHQSTQQTTAGDHYRFNAGRMNGVEGTGMAAAAAAVPTFSLPTEHQTSPGSATLEDVLASLLGLPADSHRSSVVNTNSVNNHTLQIEPLQTRRRSEGDAATRKRNDSGGSVAISTTTTNTSGNTSGSGGNDHHHQQQQHSSKQITSRDLLSTGDNRITRRVSLDSAEAAGHHHHAAGGHRGAGDYLKCRYPKCDASATLAEARKTYKSCHNCSHLYCSRECRRAHWERHRKACLHSRVSALCRLVLSACKDDADTLRHLSALARRGYLSQGRGVVRILFRSPESADSFLKQGFQCLGEVSYVRWPDLLPAEMGPELYSELLKLSTEYKPDSKMLIYVAICVVSEAPGSATAPVKWERQLVSRCAKLKLCRSVLTEQPTGIAGDPASNKPTIVTPRKDTVDEVLVLSFQILAKTTQRAREQVSNNIQSILRQRGVQLRKHYPEVHQRLATFVEGTTDRFLPVTLHPRDSGTGRSFVCIIMPNYGETGDRVQFPVSENSDDRVITIDVGADLGDDLTSKL